MNERIVERFMALRSGEAPHLMVNFDGLSHPAELVIGPLRIERETDEQQRERMRPHKEWIRKRIASDAIEVEAQEVADEEPQEFSSAQLLGDHLALLELIRIHPGFFTTQLYEYLAWSPSKGGRIRDELLAAELVTPEAKRSGARGGRKGITYQLTPKGKELLDHASRKNQTRT